MMHRNQQEWLREHALDLLDAAIDAIITIDSNGTIQSVNAATLKMFGYREDQLVGQRIELLVPAPHHDVHQSYIDHYLETGEAKIIGIGRELLAQRADGTLFPMSLAISEITKDTKHYFAGIIRDLTDQKEALRLANEQRDRLAQVGRLSTMGEMTASIAHEINQPLTAISMYAQASQRLLETPAMDVEKLRSALDKLNVQALRAGAVIERIQRFVSNEDGPRESTDLNKLVRDLEPLVSADARLHSIVLTFDLLEPLPNVLCDPVQVQQVAINLVRNSIDAIESVNGKHGNQITVSTLRSEPKTVTLRVSDCGGGIKASQQDKVFTAFHTTKKDGMGMGLSICRSIVEAHGGKLSFANNDQNGCSFELTLPLETIHER